MHPIVRPGNVLVTTLPLDCAKLVFCYLTAEDVEQLLEACPALETAMRQLELYRKPNSQEPDTSDYWTKHRIATKSTTPLPRVMRLLRPDPTEENPLWRVARQRLFSEKGQRLFSEKGIDDAIGNLWAWACGDEAIVRACDPFSSAGSDLSDHFFMLAIAILKGDIGTVRGALATQASFRSEALKTACLYTYLYNQPHMTAQLTSQDPAYALMAYAREGQRGDIMALLQQCDSDKTPLTSEDLQRGFACAALNGDNELMEQLWNRFKSADNLDLALLWATVANNPAWVQQIRLRSLPSQLSDSGMRVAILTAVLLGLSTMIEQFGDHLDIYSPAFISVILTRNVERLRQLVDHPALTSECWLMAFCLAVELGHLECLTVLIEHPPTSAAKDIHLWSSALCAAGRMNHLKMIEQIVAAWPQEIGTSLDNASATALAGAAAHGQKEAVQHLLETGRRSRQDLALALRAAARGNHRDILQLLRTHLSAGEKKGELLAVLCGAIEGDQIDLLTQVLRYNSLKAEDWAILLETAVDEGQERVLALLLEYPEGRRVCREKQSDLLGRTSYPRIPRFVLPLLRVKEASREDWDRILIYWPEVLDLVHPAYGNVDSKTVQTLYLARGNCPHLLLERCSHRALYSLLGSRGAHQMPVARTLMGRVIRAVDFLDFHRDFANL
jgi:ankyrin repeat protein